MNAGKMMMMALCAVLAVGAAEQEKGVFGTAFLDLDKDDKVELVRTMNETLTKQKEGAGEAARAKRLQTIYALNRDAVRAAKNADKKSVIAEVFATAPIDALPVITDRFATELFTREAAGLDPKTDAFVEFAAATLLKVNARVRQLPTARLPGVRSAFAVIAFLKASEGQPEDLRESLLFYVLTGSTGLARTQWIPAAMGDDGKEPSYQAMLTAGLAGEEPAHAVALPLRSPERGNKLVGSDLRVKNARDVSGPEGEGPEQGLGGEFDGNFGAVPRGSVDNKNSPWYRRHRGDKPSDEPGNYLGQTL